MQDIDPSSRHRVTVFSKKGCHLCENAIQTLQSIRAERTFDLTVVSIDDDPFLFKEYWIRVPVVQFDGVDVYEAKDMAMPGDCREKLEELFYR